jgi:hypothetical protein
LERRRRAAPVKVPAVVFATYATKQDKNMICRNSPRFDDPMRPGALEALIARNPNPAPPKMGPGPKWWKDHADLERKIIESRRPARTVEELAAVVDEHQRDVAELATVVVALESRWDGGAN